MVAPLLQGRLKLTTVDGRLTWKLQCPHCACWAEIDQDQLRGRVSVDHTDCVTGPEEYADRHPCTFHESRDWFLTAAPIDALAEQALGRLT